MTSQRVVAVAVKRDEFRSRVHNEMLDLMTVNKITKIKIQSFLRIFFKDIELVYNKFCN